MDSGNILITGGAGFVGSNLALWLRRQRPEQSVVVLDNLKRTGSELNLPRLRDAGVQFIHGDIRCPEDLDDMRLVPSVIIECSAEASVLAGYERPDYLLSTNLVGTINCLELARKHRSDVIFLSTSRVYPIEALNRVHVAETARRYNIDPRQEQAGVSARGISEAFSLTGCRSLYGATKLCSEVILQEYAVAYGVRAVINRCGVIAGPWQMGKVDQGFCALWMAHHYFGKSLSYIGWDGFGKQVRDVLHIDDLASLIGLELDNMDGVKNSTFNVGGGLDGSVSLLEATDFCQEIAGRRIPIQSVPATRAGDVRLYVTDNSRVSAATGWSPKHSPRKIFADIFAWIRDNEALVAPLWV